MCGARPAKLDPDVAGRLPGLGAFPRFYVLEKRTMPFFGDLLFSKSERSRAISSPGPE